MPRLQTGYGRACGCSIPIGDGQAWLEEAREEALQGTANAGRALGVLLACVAFPIPWSLTRRPHIRNGYSVH
jgi:hypothetical protein